MNKPSVCNVNRSKIGKFGVCTVYFTYFWYTVREKTHFEESDFEDTVCTVTFLTSFGKT